MKNQLKKSNLKKDLVSIKKNPFHLIEIKIKDVESDFFINKSQKITHLRKRESLMGLQHI